MAVILDKPELRIYEIRKRQHRKRVVFFALLLIILTAILAGGIYYTISNKKYTGYTVVHTTKRSDTSSASYYSYRSGYIRMSRDGIMAADGNGNQLWNDTYQMKDPQIAICGDYASVSDRGSKLLEIYGAKGPVGTVTTDYPIIKSVVASQGVTAVLLSGSGGNFIRYYSKEGDKLLERRTIEQEDGFPVDISISVDGTKLITSYVAFNKGEISNKITFFNFGNDGNNYIDKLVGADDYGQTLVPDVEFISNNIACAFGDDKFNVYSMEVVPEVIFGDSFKTQVKTVFYNESYIGFVLDGEDNSENNQIVVYDLKGNVVFRKSTDFDYSSIQLSKNEVIMTSNRDWVIYKLGGKIKINYHFDNEIAGILPASGRNRYIMINDGTIDEVKLK